jgi:hypothetical protein
VDEDNDASIKCVDIQKAGQSSKRQKVSDPQIGSSSEQEAEISLLPTTFEFGVKIEDDMQASVGAVLLSKFLTNRLY